MAVYQRPLWEMILAIFFLLHPKDVDRKKTGRHTFFLSLLSLYVLLNNVFSPPASPEETSRCWHFFISISPMTFSLFLIFHKIFRRFSIYYLDNKTFFLGSDAFNAALKKTLGAFINDVNLLGKVVNEFVKK